MHVPFESTTSSLSTNPRFIVPEVGSAIRANWVKRGRKRFKGS